MIPFINFRENVSNFINKDDVLTLEFLDYFNGILRDLDQIFSEKGEFFHLGKIFDTLRFYNALPNCNVTELYNSLKNEIYESNEMVRVVLVYSGICILQQELYTILNDKTSLEKDEERKRIFKEDVHTGIINCATYIRKYINAHNISDHKEDLFFKILIKPLYYDVHGIETSNIREYIMNFNVNPQDMEVVQFAKVLKKSKFSTFINRFISFNKELFTWMCAIHVSNWNYDLNEKSIFKMIAKHHLCNSMRDFAVQFTKAANHLNSHEFYDALHSDTTKLQEEYNTLLKVYPNTKRIHRNYVMNEIAHSIINFVSVRYYYLSDLDFWFRMYTR